MSSVLLNIRMYNQAWIQWRLGAIALPFELQVLLLIILYVKIYLNFFENPGWDFEMSYSYTRLCLFFLSFFLIFDLRLLKGYIQGHWVGGMWKYFRFVTTSLQIWVAVGTFSIFYNFVIFKSWSHFSMRLQKKLHIKTVKNDFVNNNGYFSVITKIIFLEQGSPTSFHGDKNYINIIIYNNIY